MKHLRRAWRSGVLAEDDYAIIDIKIALPIPTIQARIRLIYQLALHIFTQLSQTRRKMASLEAEKAVQPAHVESTVNHQDARVTDQGDREATKWQTIRRNPRVFLWCLYSVWAVLLVSYENQASGVVISIPQFRKDFGSFFDGDYVLSAQWQAAFSGAPVAS